MNESRMWLVEKIKRLMEIGRRQKRVMGSVVMKMALCTYMKTLLRRSRLCTFNLF